MKVKYLATISCLLMGSSAHAIEIMPIGSGTAPQNAQLAAPDANGPTPSYLPRSLPNQNSPATSNPSMGRPQAQLQAAPDVTLISKPPINLISKSTVPLRKKDNKPLQMANKWMNKSVSPFTGREGSVMFTFGSSLPSLICSPLRVCTIRLQSGEIVNQIDIGDSERWRITPSVSGNGSTATTHLMVKPTDSGLETNISIATNYRRYNINLVSTPHDWMPEIAFTYPEEPMDAWSNYTNLYNNPEKDAALPAAPQSQIPIIPKMHFNYKISGDDPSWKPLRVYSDGTKTYIEFSDAICSDEAPALITIDPAGHDQLVNYRMIDKNRYMVDKVIQQAALITGVDDDQTRVEIEREE